MNSYSRASLLISFLNPAATEFILDEIPSNKFKYIIWNKLRFHYQKSKLFHTITRCSKVSRTMKHYVEEMDADTGTQITWSWTSCRPLCLQEFVFLVVSVYHRIDMGPVPPPAATIAVIVLTPLHQRGASMMYRIVAFAEQSTTFNKMSIYFSAAPCKADQFTWNKQTIYIETPLMDSS